MTNTLRLPMDVDWALAQGLSLQQQRLHYKLREWHRSNKVTSRHGDNGHWKKHWKTWWIEQII